MLLPPQDGPTPEKLIDVIPSLRDARFSSLVQQDLYCVPLSETKEFTGTESDDGQVALQRAINIGQRLASKYGSGSGPGPE